MLKLEAGYCMCAVRDSQRGDMGIFQVLFPCIHNAIRFSKALGDHLYLGSETGGAARGFSQPMSRSQAQRCRGKGKDVIEIGTQEESL